MLAGKVRLILLLACCFFAFVDSEDNPEYGYCMPPWAKSWNQPNIIIFNADDVGYGDFSSYGHPTQEWNPVDDLASQGMRLTNFYSAAATCSPSRAALFTGRIPPRVGVYGRRIPVFWHNHASGLPKDEITIAEALKDAGYTTGFTGKWHLGVNEVNRTDGSHLPHNHGFDYVGHLLPNSNLWECDEEEWHTPLEDEDPFPDPLLCYLYKNHTIIQQPFSHYNLTEAFVNDAIEFIREAHQHGRPFFLYYGILQTHLNLYSGNGFRDKSKRGRYGDNMLELAWSVGAIMDEVKRLGEDFNTLSIFTSDNGPLISQCNEGGDAGNLKGGKFSYWEGGIRVPGIVHWPGHIKPASTSDVIASQIDLLPTLMNIAGGSVPTDRIIDGQDISSAILNWSTERGPVPGVEPQSQPQSSSPRSSKRRKGQTQAEDTEDDPRMLVWYCANDLHAVRYGCYKFHFRSHKTLTQEERHNEVDNCGEGGFPFQQNINCWACNPIQGQATGLPSDCNRQHDTPLMYNLCKDPNEAYPLNVTIPANKDVFNKMMIKLDEFLDEYEPGPPLLDVWSRNVHPCCSPETFPNCTCNYEYLGPNPKPGLVAQLENNP